MTNTELQEWVAQYRRTAWRLIDSFQRLGNLKSEYDALDLGNVLQEADFTALGFTKTEFTTAVSSVDTLLTTFDAGHDTNLYKVAKKD